MTKNSENYRKYLKSRTWAKKRSAAYKAHGRSCGDCGTSKGPLEVHHKTYKRRGRESPRRDLAVVCKPCHRKKHKPRGGGLWGWLNS